MANLKSARNARWKVRTQNELGSRSSPACSKMAAVGHRALSARFPLRPSFTVAMSGSSKETEAGQKERLFGCTQWVQRGLRISTLQVPWEAREQSAGAQYQVWPRCGGEQGCLSGGEGGHGGKSEARTGKTPHVPHTWGKPRVQMLQGAKGIAAGVISPV